VRKRPEIPEDVFFDTASANRADEPEERPTVEPDPDPEPPAEPEDELLAKSMETEEPDDGPARLKLSDVRKQRERKRAEEAKQKEQERPARVGRPPAQEGPKVAVTLYLTEPVAHMLEEVKFLLLTEYDVRTSKSAIADFAMRHGLDDLRAAADDLRRE